jgi:hypothetical protein
VANYIKKQKKRTDVEIFYAFGDDKDFEIDGDMSWKLSKELENFSWKYCEVDGEYKDGKFFSKVIGINKKKWKTEREV